MALVQLLVTRADLDCTNCLTNQTHDLTLYYDTVTLELKVVKRCKCTVADVEDTPYVENFKKLLEQYV